MNEMFRELYDLVFSPILTPYNLVDNAKLDNYEYVNFAKTQDGLLVTMKCSIDRNETATFFYYFDEKDNLQKVTMQSVADTTETIFDRQKDLEEAKSKLISMRNSKTSKKAI